MGSISGASARAASTRSSRSSRSSPSSVEVGPEAGGGDHLVGGDLALAVGEHEPLARGRHRARLEAGRQRDRAVVDEPADRRAERAAGRQLVVAAAAVLAAGRPPRIAHTICVAGSESRSATRSRIALNAEWPLPTTSTRLPA